MYNWVEQHLIQAKERGETAPPPKKKQLTDLSNLVGPRVALTRASIMSGVSVCSTRATL